MKKIATDRRKGASEKYFQFPLALISATEDPAELVQLITSYTAVAKGHEQERKRREALERSGDVGSDSPHGYHDWTSYVAGVADYERALLRHGERETLKNVLPHFDGRDWRHRAILFACCSPENGGLELGNLTPGHPGGTVKRYERAAAFLKQYAEASGEENDFEVRIAADVIWDHLDPRKGSSMSMREFRVLAAVYARLGGNGGKPVAKALYLKDLRHVAAGFNTREGYDAARALTAPGETADGQAGVELDGVDLSGLGLPRLPDGFQEGSWQGSTGAGWFRYDQAVTYHRRHPSAVPLVGEGGMFEVLLTEAGVLFELRPEYFPADGEPPKVGTFKPLDVYDAGERVVYYTGKMGRGYSRRPGRLEVGTITDVGSNVRVRFGSEEPKKIHRTHGRITPLRYVEAELRAAAAEVPAAAPWTPPELLSVDQLRRTLDAMERLGWFARIRPNRRKSYFSHNMSPDELTAWWGKRQAARAKKKNERELRELALQVAKAEAEAEQMEAKAMLRRQLEEAKRRKVEAAAELAEPSRHIPASAPAPAPSPPRESPAIVPPLIEGPSVEARSDRKQQYKTPSSSAEEEQQQQQQIARVKDDEGGDEPRKKAPSFEVPAPFRTGSEAPPQHGGEAEAEPPTGGDGEGLVTGSLFGTPAIQKKAAPETPSTDAASASESEPDGVEADAAPAEPETEERGAAEATPEDATPEDLPGSDRKPEPERLTPPPADALTHAEAYRLWLDRDGEGSLTGAGGLFERVQTVDGRTWYVERGADVVARERAALEFSAEAEAGQAAKQQGAA